MTRTDFDRKLSTDQIRWIVAQACRAPSVHNTQPWRFHYADGGFELWADTTRGLTVTDPAGRELVISCGAALFNLRLAARKLGFDTSVHTLPDPAQPRLLARLALSEGSPADVVERRAFAAMIRRHTHRGGFAPDPLAPDLAVHLQHAAEAEGAKLIYLSQPGQRRHVLRLARAAERVIGLNFRAQEELAGWTPDPAAARRDGVPATAYAARPQSGIDELPTRDFDQGRGRGLATAAGSMPGTIGVLATAEDTEAGWLAAGRALQAVLVRAAGDWAFAALDSQLLEVASLRAELRRALTTADHPQLLLRFGYAGDAPLTPRRHVDEVLDID
jgi:hypothetical protein